MKEEMKNPKSVLEYTICKQWKRVVSGVRKILRTKIRVSEENTLMLLSNCAVCCKKKSRFIKNQELH